MENTISLTIPKPCSEKWDNFTPTQQGGFCSSCNKVVVDFTTMTDDEVTSFITQNAKACGRFRVDQLRTYPLTSPQKIYLGLTLLRAGFASLLLLLLSRESPAQSTVGKAKIEVTEKRNDTTTEITKGGKVKGIVRSKDDGEPLPGVNVMLKGTTQGTVTDLNGRFEFPEELKPNDVLVFAFIGLVTKEYRITEKTQFNVDLPMQLCMDMDFELTGEVSVVGAYEPRRSIFTRMWTKVKSAF